LYSATGRACRRKWRYIKYTPLPFTFKTKLIGSKLNKQVTQLTDVIASVKTISENIFIVIILLGNK